MGSIVNAICECGFNKEKMYLGGGKRNHNSVCSFPFYCDQCKIIFTVNLYNPLTNCPDCGADSIISYEDKKINIGEGRKVFSWNTRLTLGRELVLTDSKYWCPSCKKYDLKFTSVGRWD
jgi:ribosomal protein L37AE/L43A